MLSALFIRRPVTAKVIAIIILIVGLIALKLLPVAMFPSIVPPTVQVNAFLSGGDAQTIEKQVTQPIEEQINGCEGMIYMQSTSANGVSNIRVFFKPGYDLDKAAMDVQNRVALALPKLPEAVKRVGVSSKKVSTSMLEILGLYSSDSKHDALFLSNYAAQHIVDALKRVPGVSDVTILGERRYAMRIWLDPDKLTALGLTTEAVARAIRSQNRQAALGSVADMAKRLESRLQYTLIAKSRLDDPKEFERIVLRQNRDGSQVRLRDVAKVEVASQSYESSATLNGRPVAAIAVFQLPGANALAVADAVKAKIEQLRQNFPEGVQIRTTYDTTLFVRASIKEVAVTLFEALVLVLLVVYVFLQSWRATIIPAVAIPISLIGTFAFLYLFGYSLNMLTLFGLILAIGIVVDDAILVVENVETVMQKDPTLSVKEATHEAMREIFVPVITTTLVLLAVFIPVTFIPGISGAMYRQFALTIAFSVLISSLVALTLSPALAAQLLRRRKKDPNLFFKAFNRGLDRLKRGYAALLKRLVRWRYAVLGLYIVGVIATVWIFRTLPSAFLPEEDQGTIFATLSLPPGSVLADTEATAEKAAAAIRALPGIEDVAVVSGYDLTTGLSDTAVATFFIALKDWDKRKEPRLQLQPLIQQIQTTMRHSAQEAKVMAFAPPSVPGLSAVGGFEAKLINVGDLKDREFEKIAVDFIGELNRDPRIATAYTSYRADYPKYRLVIDRLKAAALGVDMNALFGVLEGYFGSVYVNDFSRWGKNYRVIIQAAPQYRHNISDVTALFVKNAENRSVPLSAILKVEATVGPNALTHFNGQRSIDIGGVHAMAEGYGSGDALKAIQAHAAKLPKGVRVAFAGASLQELEAADAALYVFALSLLMVFLLLAAQYESWMMPLIIMLPIPVVMFGALGANMLAGLLNDIYTQIGLVLLIGMSSKNAILIVEFAKELHEKGMGIVESSVQAATLRMRAILMTVLSFLLGILPLLVASGAGAASRKSLGTAVFGGMMMSTLLTFLLTPVLFVVLQEWRERWGAKGGDGA